MWCAISKLKTHDCCHQSGHDNSGGEDAIGYADELYCGQVVGHMADDSGEEPGDEIICHKPAGRVYVGSKDQPEEDGICDECFERGIANGGFVRLEAEELYPLLAPILAALKIADAVVPRGG